MSDLSDYINSIVYNPYSIKFDVEVTEDERVIIKTDHWFVSLSSKKGEFSFFGYCLSYWEIDTVKDIRDKFGDIFSYLNHIRRGKEFVSQAVKERDEELISDKEERVKWQKKEWEKEHKEKSRKSKREWYARNREKVKEYARNYYLKKKKEKS